MSGASHQAPYGPIVTVLRRLVRARGSAPGAWLDGTEATDAGRSWARAGFAASVILVLVATGLVTAAVAAAGGAPNPLTQLLYVPILYVAVRHGRLGALVMAVVAGLAVGPWMPSSNAPSGHQGFRDWGLRLLVFVLVGFVTAWLASQISRPFAVIARDAWLGQALRAAVRQRRIRVHYQPFIDLTDGRVLGVEALCRWKSLRGRPMAPDVFIPAAEHTGAIAAVSRAVFRQSAAQFGEWATQHGAGLTMSINVSAVELCKPAFLVDLTRLAAGAAESGYRLCIEVTETAIIARTDEALLVLSAAREMGVLVALDDFGTGESSLAYLGGFPIDIVKIDLSFVAAVDVDETAHAIVSAIVSMASSLGAATIAEGVERPGQLRALRDLGCDIGQGYYLGRPAAAAGVDWTRRTLA